MNRLICTTTLLAVIAISGRAFGDPKAEAKEHIERATALHHDGHYAEALDELKTAYTLDPQPELLYGIAQIHVKLGQCPQAITFYERFLTSDPKPGPAGAARQAIEICKSNPPPVADVQPETKPEPHKPELPKLEALPVATDQPPPWYLADKLADGLVIGGAVSGIIAVVSYASARSDLAQAKQQNSYPKQAALVDSANSNRATAVVFGVGAAGLIGAGVVHYLLNRPDDGGVGVAPAHGGGVVTWNARF